MNGKRSRKFFETKTQAEAYRDVKNIELENNGREHAEFDSRLRDMATECNGILRDFGATILDATRHYVAHLKSVERSCTVAALADEVIAAKKKACGKKQRPASDDYISDLTVRLGRFKKDFGERIVATITRLEIDDWLSGLKDKRGKTFRHNHAETTHARWALRLATR